MWLGSCVVVCAFACLRAPATTQGSQRPSKGKKMPLPGKQRLFNCRYSGCQVSVTIFLHSGDVLENHTPGDEPGVC